MSLISGSKKDNLDNDLFSLFDGESCKGLWIGVDKKTYVTSKDTCLDYQLSINGYIFCANCSYVRNQCKNLGIPIGYCIDRSAISDYLSCRRCNGKSNVLSGQLSFFDYL